MAKPLTFFKICAGFDAKLISTAQCTRDTAYSGLEFVLQILANSETVVEAQFVFEGSGEEPSYICKYCFYDLMEAMFEISHSERNTCVRYFYSWGCIMALQRRCEMFWKCAIGWQLDIVASRPAFQAILDI